MTVTESTPASEPDFKTFLAEERRLYFEAQAKRRARLLARVADKKKELAAIKEERRPIVNEINRLLRRVLRMHTKLEQRIIKECAAIRGVRKQITALREQRRRITHRIEMKIDDIHDHHNRARIRRGNDVTQRIKHAAQLKFTANFHRRFHEGTMKRELELA